MNHALSAQTCCPRPLSDKLVLLGLCLTLTALSGCKELDEVFAPGDEYREPTKEDKDRVAEQAARQARSHQGQLEARVQAAMRGESTLGPEPTAADELVPWLVRSRAQCEKMDCPAEILSRLRGMGDISGALLKMSDDSAASVRRQAVELVGLLQLKQGSPGLVELLDHREGLVREAACRSLGWMQDPAVAPGIVARLRTASRSGFRVCLIGALGGLEAPAAYGYLEGASQSRNQDEALAAVRGLGQSKGDRAAKGLEAVVMLSESVVVKLAALDALGSMETKTARKALKAAVRSPQPDVKKRARELLKRKKRPRR